MTRPLLGVNLPPDPRFLALALGVIEDEAECLELTPETFWRAGCEPGPLYDLAAGIAQRSGKPILGHGVGLSLGAPVPDERLETWIAALRRDREVFGYRWYSEHLGFVDHGSEHAALPLPLPPTDEAVTAVSARLDRLREVTPDVAFENNVTYFALGDPADEPAFLNRILDVADCGLLLDLHNVYTQCANFGLATRDYLGALDLSRVIEIHVSGGSLSDPDWLPSRRVLRLDSHDGPVPDEVWSDLEWVLPRCPGLRAVVLERVDGTLTEDEVPGYEADVARLRSVLC